MPKKITVSEEVSSFLDDNILNHRGSYYKLIRRILAHFFSRYSIVTPENIADAKFNIGLSKSDLIYYNRVLEDYYQWQQRNNERHDEERKKTLDCGRN